MSRTIMLVMPGAALMEITKIPAGVRVRCPGCGEVLIIRDSDAERGGDLSLAHEDDCPIHARINDVIEAYERNTVRYG